MILKDMLNQVLLQSGFLERGGFTGSSDVDDKQMVAIANRAAIEIMNFWTWPELRTSFNIPLNTGQNRYTLPADYQDLVPNSAWETNGERIVDFPVPDNLWFMYKFTDWSDGGTLRVRKYGNEIEVHDPTSGEAFDIEYISKCRCWALRLEISEDRSRGAQFRVLYRLVGIGDDSRSPFGTSELRGSLSLLDGI